MALHAAPLDLARGFDIARVQKNGAALQTAAQLHAALEIQSAERVLALGIPALDEVLPQGGLVRGSVVELQALGSCGAATSFALCACRAAQQAASAWRQGRSPEAQRPWCAFIDPSASLFAPGIARLGVELDRLLVVRPEVDAIERVAIRIAEAKVVSLLVVDLRGALEGLPVSSQRRQRTVRRLALAVKHLGTCVLLITPAEPRLALPLPVAMRLEFSRVQADSFEIRVGKERSGRVSSSRRVSWSVFEEVWQ